MRDGVWESNADFSADALGDMKTSGCRLSVYMADSQDDVRLITAALASGRPRFDVIDLIIFDESVLNDLGVELVECEGTTISNKANMLHRDLANITGFTLPQIISRIIWGSGEVVRVRKEDLKKRLLESMENGAIPVERAPEWMQRLRVA